MQCAFISWRYKYGIYEMKILVDEKNYLKPIWLVNIYKIGFYRWFIISNQLCKKGRWPKSLFVISTINISVGKGSQEFCKKNVWHNGKNAFAAEKVLLPSEKCETFSGVPKKWMPFFKKKMRSKKSGMRSFHNRKRSG
jgi:hypothetical protein